ncbi:MAG: DUF4019 domain-containing protein [Burkholderiaceae bacterium]
MNIARGLALAALLAMLGAASAQLKPPGPSTPQLPPSPTELQRTEAQSSKELAARGAAEKWLALLDAGEYGKAWDGCAQLFRQRVTRQQWVESLPQTRSPFGKMKERRNEVATYKTSLPGAPDGEYVTVRFGTKFEKKDDAEELLTLVLEDGVWRPTGYFIR